MCACCVQHATKHGDAYKTTRWITQRYSNFWAVLCKRQSLTVWHRMTHRAEKVPRHRNCWLGDRLLWSRSTVTSRTSSELRHRRFGVRCVKELCFVWLWNNYRRRLEWINRGVWGMWWVSADQQSGCGIFVSRLHTDRQTDRHPLHLRPLSEPVVTLVNQKAT